MAGLRSIALLILAVVNQAPVHRCLQEEGGPPQNHFEQPHVRTISGKVIPGGGLERENVSEQEEDDDLWLRLSFLYDGWWKILVWCVGLAIVLCCCCYVSRCCYLCWDCCTDPFWGYCPSERSRCCERFLLMKCFSKDGSNDDRERIETYYQIDRLQNETDDEALGAETLPNKKRSRRRKIPSFHPRQEEEEGMEEAMPQVSCDYKLCPYEFHIQEHY